MSTHSKIPSGLGARRDRIVQEYQHDSYKLRGKLKEPTVCTECGALFHKGRWTWLPRLAGADEIVCPACLRIRDKYPKGFLTLAAPVISTTDTHLPRRIGETLHHAYEGTFYVHYDAEEQFIRVTWSR